MEARQISLINNYMNFDDLIATQKGRLGEQLVDCIIASMGAQIYESQKKGTPHYLDRLFILPNGDVFAADAKAKCARSLYQDSGVDRRHFLRYQSINNNTPFIIFFVDEHIGSVYGNYLDGLMVEKIMWTGRGSGFQRYPFYDNNNREPMVYFPLINMVKYGNIDDIACEKLKALSERSYYYPNYEYPEWLY